MELSNMKYRSDLIKKEVFITKFKKRRGDL